MHRPGESTEPNEGASTRRAAVLGKPVEHSLSPVLHEAAYRALGLTGWSYERFEVDGDQLPELVRGLDAEWVGLSVTMPGKRAALEFANEVTDKAAMTGAANTLVRQEPRPDGVARWLADCTDVDGVVGAIRAVGGDRGLPGRATSSRTGIVLGAGGTAAAAVVGLAELGVSHVHLIVREPSRAQETLAAARSAGLTADVLRFDDVVLSDLADSSAVVISTVPPDVTAPYADQLASAPCVLDVLYHPWPTPLAQAVQARGGLLATGLDMLLHQAFGQVEHFTGMPAPRESMRDALLEATGNVLLLPLQR